MLGRLMVKNYSFSVRESDWLSLVNFCLSWITPWIGIFCQNCTSQLFSYCIHSSVVILLKKLSKLMGYSLHGEIWLVSRVTWNVWCGIQVFSTTCLSIFIADISWKRCTMVQCIPFLSLRGFRSNSVNFREWKDSWVISWLLPFFQSHSGALCGPLVWYNLTIFPWVPVLRSVHPVGV